MAGASNNNSARTIEQVVRAEALLLGVFLCALGGILVHRGGAAAWVGLVPVAACLAGLARLLGRLPLRSLLKLVQYGLVGLVVALFFGLALGPHLGFYRTLTVLSGSMRPTFNPGDVIVVRSEALRDVRAGQVIAYTIPIGSRPLETHRVIKVLERGDVPVVQTKGDANNWRDPWTAKLHGDKAWRLSVVIPKLGFAISLLRSPFVHTAAILVAPGLIALMFLAEIWGLKPRLPRVPRRPRLGIADR